MSDYYTLADVERLGPAGCLNHMNELHRTNNHLYDEIEVLNREDTMTYTDVVRVRLSEQDRERAKKVAAAEQRSLSSLMRIALIHYLATKAHQDNPAQERAAV